jgi:hypothetical protein
METKEAVERLEALTWADPEHAHSEADKILVEVLRANGLHEVAEAYMAAMVRVGFWYS